jgi:hypothetical protein
MVSGNSPRRGVGKLNHPDAIDLSDPHRGRAAASQQAVYELAVSSYDRAESMVIALLLLFGITVAGLLIIFFTSRMFARNKSIPVTLASVASRPEGAALGVSRDFEPPGLEELPDLLEPQLQEALSSLSDAVTSKVAILDDKALEADLVAGQGRGAGDSRQVGIGAEGTLEKVPRAERWEIRFQGGTLREYAQQLDAFGIELATIGADNRVHYAYHLSQKTPDRRVGPPEAEKRMYMVWRSGPLIEADRQLLARAGIPTLGRILLQFYPAKTEQMLATLEKAYAGQHDVNEIRKTILAVKPDGNQFAFYVVDQKYF